MGLISKPVSFLPLNLASLPRTLKVKLLNPGVKSKPSVIPRVILLRKSSLPKLRVAGSTKLVLGKNVRVGCVSCVGLGIIPIKGGGVVGIGLTPGTILVGMGEGLPVGGLMNGLTGTVTVGIIGGLGLGPILGIALGPAPLANKPL